MKILVKRCPKCCARMKYIACPDNSRRWICQNIRCDLSKVIGYYNK